MTSAGVWLATVAIIATGDWWLTCIRNGDRLSGIDCLAGDAEVHAASAPARWFGFAPLAVTWAIASFALVACATTYATRRRRGA